MHLKVYVKECKDRIAPNDVCLTKTSTDVFEGNKDVSVRMADIKMCLQGMQLKMWL
jgi:hypothetical protein